MATAKARIGDTILKLEGISLAFGGVKALTDISFDVREHEVRAIIGPNGAGQELDAQRHQRRLSAAAGTITFRGRVRRDMTRTRRRRTASRARSRTSRFSRACRCSTTS
jgi:branched-chain amino acid transport system ATP-binding protein